MSTYNLNDLMANVRTHVPDFDMATEIMKRMRCWEESIKNDNLIDNLTEAYEAGDPDKLWHVFEAYIDGETP